MEKAVERAEINFTGLLNAALEEKRAEEVALCAVEVPNGEKLTAWNTTPEEIARINAGDRSAVDRFFFDNGNYNHIKSSAYAFFRREQRFKTIIDIDDLMQQVYLDLASGLIKFRAFDRGISGAIFTSFKFSPVGGLDEVYIVNEKRRATKWGK